MVKPVSFFSDMKPVVHGGLNYMNLSRADKSPEDILDFSVSVNPLSPHPDVLEAIEKAPITRYPDPSCSSLKRTISRYMGGISIDSIIVTNGISQAIWLVSIAYIREGTKVAVVTPTYGEYVQPSLVLGADVRLWNLREEMSSDRGLLTEKIERGLFEERPVVLWICNPNNPTGNLLLREDIERLVSCCIDTDTLLVLDEAYLNFVDRPPCVLDLIESGHLLLLRSMTKDYGVPGLRLGYCLGSHETIRAMSLAQPDWSVNSQAQVAGVALLENKIYYEKQWSEMRSLKKELAASLKEAGISVIYGEANFLLCSHPCWKDLYCFLNENNVQVRNCSSFGMEGFFRVGIRCRADNLCLIDLMSRFSKGKITLVLGGARSGKSSFAQDLVEKDSENSCDSPVYYLATSKVEDDEMARRVARHKEDRPSDWITLEEALKPSEVLSHLPDRSIVLMDCVTMLVTNLMLQDELNWDNLTDDEEKDLEHVVLDEIDRIIVVSRAKALDLVLVSNELGTGLVPPYPLGRLFRDLAGWANQRLGGACDVSYYLIAGMAQKIK